MHFDSCHVYIFFYIQLFQKRIKIQINIWKKIILQRKSTRLHVWIFNI